MVNKCKSGGLPIALTCDEQYVKYASVVISSIMANANPDCCYEINIVSEQISQRYQELLLEQVKQKANFSLRFVFLENLDVSRFYLNSYITVSTYYRFYLPRLFPEYDRILYLDCDLVVDGDISQLAIMNFEDKGLMACRDVWVNGFLERGDSDVYTRDYFEIALKMPRAEDYFNAGIILFNLKMIRDRGLDELLFETIQEIPQPLLQDQDILNSVFSRNGGVKNLPLSYNCTEYQGRKKVFCSMLSCKKGNQDQIIRHYIGAIKPWKNEFRFSKGLLEIDHSIYFYKYLLSKYTPREVRQEIIVQNGLKIPPLAYVIAKYLL